jgi:hypothetical protein
MPEYGKDEALAFIEAMRLTIAGKTGFKWMTERLSDLGDFVVEVTAENERLNGFIDATGAREHYESYRATHPEG